MGWLHCHQPAGDGKPFSRKISRSRAGRSRIFGLGDCRFHAKTLVVGSEEIVKEVMRIASGAGVSEDVVQLLESKTSSLAWRIDSLEQQNSSLIEENHLLAAENKRLKDQLSSNGQAPADDLEPKTGEVLKYFFDQGRDISDFEVATHFQIDLKTASRHTEILLKKKLIEITWEEIQTWHGNCPPLYSIAEEGKRFIKTTPAPVRSKV